MAEIFITDRGESTLNLDYVEKTLGELFHTLSCGIERKTVGARDSLKIIAPDDYFTTVQVEVADKLADVVAINYKYVFFKDKIRVSGLSLLEKELLTASLISADFEEDKSYALNKLKTETFISLDGTFNFRMKPLKSKWQEISECLPTCFIRTQLKEFIGFLLETRREKVYIDCGKVYDSHFRRLVRSDLLDGGDECKIIKEILLSSGGKIEIFGNIPSRDEEYIKEFYSGKISFKKEFADKRS